MFKAPFRSAWALALPLIFALPGAALAQKDEIIWRDASITKGAKVTDFNATDIKFRAGNSNQTKPSHLVKELTVEKWKEVLGRAGDDPEALVGEAQALNGKDDFTAQACYWRAAEIYREAGDEANMLAALQQMYEKNPRSGYAPYYFRRKVLYYLSRAKPDLKSAASIAEKYGAACRMNAWSRAFELDAELWQKRVKSADKKGGGVDAFITELKDLIGRAAGVAEFVAIDASADLADAYRQKKQYAEARTTYEGLQKKKGLNDTTLARVYVGLGYIHLELALAESNPAKQKEEYHSAFISFLKVYLNCKEANATIVAEGLYNAAKACEQWGELPTCKQMAGRLRGRLKYRSPYKETFWAKKK